MYSIHSARFLDALYCLHCGVCTVDSVVCTVKSTCKIQNCNVAMLQDPALSLGVGLPLKIIYS